MIHLGQLLAYLARADVTELVVASGRPITIMAGGEYRPLTASSISTSQIQELLRGTELERLVPQNNSGGVVRVATIGGTQYRVLIARRDNGLSLTVERNSEDVPQPTPAPSERLGGSRNPTPVSSERSASTRTTTGVHGPARPTSDRITITERTAPSNDPRNAMADDRGLASARRLSRTVDQPGTDPPPKRAGTAPIEIERSPYEDRALGSQPRRAGTSPISLDLDPGDDVELGAPGARPAKFASASTPDYTPPPHSPTQYPAPPAYNPPAIRTPTPPSRPIPVQRQEPSGPIAPPEPATRTTTSRKARIITTGPRAIPDALVELVTGARQRHATDLHLTPGQPPRIRMVGDLLSGSNPLDAATVSSLIEPLLGPAEQAALSSRGYCDLALDVGGGRVRANISRVRGGLKGAFRLIWKGVPTLSALGLPEELARVTNYHQGLVVIAGPSGHGKTTTMAALVDLINSTKPQHILSIEDPIEIVHPRKTAVVSQRAVGMHTLSFARALKASLREDPDVIVIGEIRDRETVEIALTAAETGHLVIVTMSTPNAAKTIDRLIDMFPPDDQAQVRASLAAALRFIVTQRLVPTRDGDRVVPAVELLAGVLPVAALIRDNKLFQLPSVQQRGRAWGMIRFDDSLLEHFRAGAIDEATALATAENPRELRNVLSQPFAPKGSPKR